MNPQINTFGKAPTLMHPPLEIDKEQIFGDTGGSKEPLELGPLSTDSGLIATKLLGSKPATTSPLIIINDTE